MLGPPFKLTQIDSSFSQYSHLSRIIASDSQVPNPTTTATMWRGTSTQASSATTFDSPELTGSLVCNETEYHLRAHIAYLTSLLSLTQTRVTEVERQRDDEEMKRMEIEENSRQYIESAETERDERKKWETLKYYWQQYMEAGDRKNSDEMAKTWENVKTTWQKIQIVAPSETPTRLRTGSNTNAIYRAAAISTTGQPPLKKTRLVGTYISQQRTSQRSSGHASQLPEFQNQTAVLAIGESITGMREMPFRVDYMQYRSPGGTRGGGIREDSSHQYPLPVALAVTTDDVTVTVKEEKSGKFFIFIYLFVAVSGDCQWGTRKLSTVAYGSFRIFLNISRSLFALWPPYSFSVEITDISHLSPMNRSTANPRLQRQRRQKRYRPRRRPGDPETQNHPHLELVLFK